MISTLGSRALLVRKKTRHNKNVSCEKWLPILWRSEWLFYRQAEFQISISIVFWKTLAGVNSTTGIRVGLNLLHPTAYLAPIYTSHFYDEDETHLFLLFWWLFVVERLRSSSWIRFSSVGTFLDSNSKSWTFFKLEANNSRVVCNSSTRLRL